MNYNHDNQPIPAILIVDDEPEIIKALFRVIRPLPAEVFTADSGEKACEIMRRSKIDVLISDMKMPAMSGAELISWASKHSPDTYRMILTGFADLNSIVDSINRGSVQRFLQKPWSNDDLIRAVTEAIEYTALKDENARLNSLIKVKNKRLKLANQALEGKVVQRTKQIKVALKRIEDERKDTVKILFNFIGIHNVLSSDYAIKVSRLASSIARKMGLPARAVSSIQMASMLCEIGLLGADSEDILKPFETLNIQQREAYFEQINDASTLLLPAAHLSDVTDIITQQYESWDGQGFPGQRSDQDICLGARILSVSRDFWRWVEGRIVDEKLDYQTALSQLKKARAKRYDPTIVNILESDFDKLISAHYGEQVSSLELAPGMVLLEGVFSEKHRMVLVEGHEFSEDTIKRIRQYEARQNTRFKFNVKTIEPKDVEETLIIE